MDTSSIVSYSSMNYPPPFFFKEKNKVTHCYAGGRGTSETDTLTLVNKKTPHTQASQEVSSFPAGDQKAARNRQDRITKTNMKHKYQK